MFHDVREEIRAWAEALRRVADWDFTEITDPVLKLDKNWPGR
jgi:hypothetical protein